MRSLRSKLGVRRWILFFALSLAHTAIASACATTPRFEDRSTCLQVAKRDFQQCLNTTLNNDADLDLDDRDCDEIDPAPLSEPPLIDRTSCEHVYERQREKCSELPSGELYGPRAP